MATAIKKCRVCGKSYEACHTIRHVAGGFRWQEVACSPKCGSIYLARIEESRRVKPTDIKEEKAVKAIGVVDFVEDDDIDDDELYDELDEYFDDAE